MAGGLKMSLLMSPVVVALAVPGSIAYGQASGLLPDPTRPPLQADPTPAATQTAPDPAAALGGLQMIVLRKGNKSVAVINGVTVKIGGKVGDATLVQLTDSTAVLSGPAGREVLHMTPGVAKTAPVPLKPDSGAEKVDRTRKKPATAEQVK